MLIWLQFMILGAVLIALEFLVDGTVGLLAGADRGLARAASDRGADWTLRPAAYSSG